MSIKHHFHGCQKAPLVRASLVKRRYIKYPAFFTLKKTVNVRQFTFKFGDSLGSNNSLRQTFETTHTSTKNRLQTTGYGRMAVLGIRIWYVSSKYVHVLSYFAGGN